MNQIGYETPFEGVKKLAPGSIMTVENGGVTIKENPWRPSSAADRDASPKTNASPIKEALPTKDSSPIKGASPKKDSLAGKDISGERWAATVLGVIDRTRDGRAVSLGLSGGLDSRVVLALLTKSGIPFRAHVYGLPDVPDVRISTSISRKLGLEHRHYEPHLPPVEELAESACRHASVTMATRPASDVLNLPMFREAGAAGSVLVDGGFGEIGRRQYLKRLWYLARWALYRNDSRTITRHLMDSKPMIFAPEIASKMKEGLEENVEREWMRVRNMGLDMPTTLDLFALRHRVPNFGAPIQAVMDQILPNIMPLIHPDVLDVSFAMPARQKSGSRLFRNTIERYAPELQDFPLAKGESEVPYQHGFWRSQIGGRLRRSLRMQRSEQSGNTGNNGQPASIPVLFLKHIEPWLMDLAGSREVRECGIYDMAELKRRIDAFSAGDVSHAAWLDWWLAFEGFRLGK
ncbi:MAG: hypothetical protein EA364_14010 [Balneolaceae bacterium]|nr:MAG: hypothetical protein EA364_14010 [Balneolaceae bacterium]